MESSPAAVDRGPLSFFGFGATEDAPAAADEERSTPPPDPSRLTTCQPTLMPDMSEFEEKDGRATDWMPGGDSGSATTLDERVPIGPAKGGTGSPRATTRKPGETGTRRPRSAAGSEASSS